MKCNKCGSELESGAKFCAVCGEPVPQAPEGDGAAQQPYQSAPQQQPTYNYGAPQQDASYSYGAAQPQASPVYALSLIHISAGLAKGAVFGVVDAAIRASQKIDLLFPKAGAIAAKPASEYPYYTQGRAFSQQYSRFRQTFVRNLTDTFPKRRGQTARNS